MKKYDNIIIGFGKGGKTVAGALAGHGETVALIEKSLKMYGGTCINVACIPSKFLENASHLSKGYESFEEKAAYYKETIEKKNTLIEKLRGKNYHKLADAANAQVLTGTASFLNGHQVQVEFPNGEKEVLEGKRIFINTGAAPLIPDIKGVKESHFTYTSETMMERKELPKHLVIIGGGYIGVEFASYYANFGSQVTVIQNGAHFIPREDQEVAKAAFESMKEREIQILEETAVESVEDAGDHAVVTVKNQEGVRKLEADAILVATGRRPNLKGLNLEAAGVKLTERGAIQTDETLKTTAPDIWAMGDVTGGLQFTYMSLDDSRIVKSQILGDGKRTTKNRGNVPYSIFIDPPFSRVGLTEKEAREKGFKIKTGRLAAAAIPKAQVLGKPTGLLKVIVDAGTDQILGAHLFCAESHELINTIKLAMDAGLPYTVLRDGIYTHPTMSEAFNDLFASLA